MSQGKSPIGPGGQWTPTPRDVVSLEGKGLEVDVRGLEQRNDGDSIHSIVVRQGSPFNHLRQSLQEDVWICRRVDDDCYAHATDGRLFHDNVDSGVPGSQLVVDPEAINTVRLHQIQLLLHNTASRQDVLPQVALVVVVACTPMVVKAIVEAHEPGHVMHHVLRLQVAWWGRARPRQAHRVGHGAARQTRRTCPELAAIWRVLDADADREFQASRLSRFNLDSSKFNQK